MRIMKSNIQLILCSLLMVLGSLFTACEVIPAGDRDKVIFTNKRLITLNVQGVTGHKRNYHSIPYRSITRFSVETSGTFDLDGEMKVWVSGDNTPYSFEFSRKIDVKTLQRTLAAHVLM